MTEAPQSYPVTADAILRRLAAASFIDGTIHEAIQEAKKYVDDNPGGDAQASPTLLDIAQAICRSDVSGPTCVMDEHPERPPCSDDNCNRFAQARAVLALSSTDPRCTCAAIVNPNIPHARSCPLSSTDREMFKCNCPHEVRSGCSEPACPHYAPAHSSTQRGGK